VPTLVVDGDQDLRPRWAVDSLVAALPDVRRVTLTGTGNVPWVEDPAGFGDAVARFLSSESSQGQGPGGAARSHGLSG
jgi:proline iminopeptidase